VHSETQMFTERLVNGCASRCTYWSVKLIFWNCFREIEMYSPFWNVYVDFSHR